MGPQRWSARRGNAAAYVFTRSGGSVGSFRHATWTQQKLMGTDPATGDLFGSSVALSGDGNDALIGAPGPTVVAAPSSTSPAGAWYKSSRRATQVEGDRFGCSISLSPDGSTVVVGADGKGSPPGQPMSSRSLVTGLNSRSCAQGAGWGIWILRRGRPRSDSDRRQGCDLRILRGHQLGASTEVPAHRERRRWVFNWTERGWHYCAGGRSWHGSGMPLQLGWRDVGQRTASARVQRPVGQRWFWVFGLPQLRRQHRHNRSKGMGVLDGAHVFAPGPVRLAIP